MPHSTDPAADGAIRHETERCANAPPASETADGTVRNETKHFNSAPPSADAADGTIRHDAERFGAEPHSPLTTTTHRPQGTIRHDAERFGNHPETSDEDDGTNRHGTEHFAIAPATARYPTPSGITYVHLPAVPRVDPDVPDGVLPYADVLCARQQAAIELLLAGERPGVVAEKLGIGRTTLWRWRTYDWDFRRALAAAREAIFGEAVERLRGLVPEAVELLQTRMRSGNDLAAVRLLRLARVERYQSEVEDHREKDQLPWDEPLHDRHPAAPIRKMLPGRAGGED